MNVDSVLADESGAFPITVVEADASTGDYASLLWAERGLLCREMRATRMLTELGVFQEFGATLQFPAYFSGGWDGTYEFIRDLNWLRAESGYVLIITDAEYLLLEDQDRMPQLINLLSSATEEWSRAQMSTPKDRWRERARPFHTVLFTENFDLLQSRWPIPLEVVDLTDIEADH